MSDQDRISPYHIYTISCRQVMRIKKNIHYTITNWILYQIPQTNIMRIILQTVRGIDNEILGVQGLSHDCENEIG